MPFNYRDKSHLVDKLRGKSGEEILNELKSDLNSQGRRMFFDSPSWRPRQSNSAFPRGFPFDDDRNRINIRTYLDEIAARHPEFASQLKERSWGEDFSDPSFARTESSGAEFRPRNDESEASGSKQPEVQEPVQNLSNFGLRNTVPLGPQASSEQDRHQRSMSAPPENSGASKRFVTKCEIPVMNNPMQESVQIKPDLAGKGPQEPNLQKANNAPSVRVIPIQVEGRDTPLVNTNVDTSANFGAEKFSEPFEGRLPRDFGSYQRHSPRFAHKERAPTPPQYQYAPQFQQYVPPSQHFMPQQPQAFAHQQPSQAFGHQQPPQAFGHQQPPQAFGHQQQPQAFAHQQQHPQKPPAPPPQFQQQQHQHPQPQSQQQQPHGTKLPQEDEPDSKPPQPKPEPIKDPIDKVQAIQKEVDELMKEVEAFNGTSRTDKQYLMLDELLTRQLLLLDNIDTEGKDNVRQARKDTIRSIQRCISTLENKVPVLEKTENATESVTNQEEANKTTESGTSQPMDVDKTKENTPVGSKDSQKMEVDETVGSHSQSEQRQDTTQQQDQPSDQSKEENKEKI